MFKQLKVVELFSGIGSQAKALKNIGANFATVLTCEWDVRAMVAYDIIHCGGKIHKDAIDLNKAELLKKLSSYNLSGDCINPLVGVSLSSLGEQALRQIYSTILNIHNKVNIKDLHGKDIPANTDIVTYSFPCQDLSNVGHLHGYNKGIDRASGTRSGLLWEVERILNERVEESLDLPKVLVLENVTALLAQRHNANFEEWKLKLESLGYYNKVYSLDSYNFGSVQRRKRLIMLSVLVTNEKRPALEEFFRTHDLGLYRDNESNQEKIRKLKKILTIGRTAKKYMEEAIHSQPNATESRKKIWTDNLKIYDEKKKYAAHVATITTKQDRHPNSGNIYFDYPNNIKSKYRFLTPRECFCLMGFTEVEYERIIAANMPTRKNQTFFTRDNLLHIAGNSIVVQVLEKVFEQIIEILDLLYNES